MTVSAAGNGHVLKAHLSGANAFSKTNTASRIPAASAAEIVAADAYHPTFTRITVMPVSRIVSRSVSEMYVSRCLRNAAATTSSPR